MRNLTIDAGSRQFTVTAGEKVKDTAIIQRENADGIVVYEVRLAFSDLGGDCAVSLLWNEPMKGVVGFWSPQAGRGHELHQWWAANTQTSYLAEGAPVIALFYQGGQNYRTAALSEAEQKTKLSVCVNDFAERESLDMRVSIFEEEAPPADSFTFYLRIDQSERGLSQTIGDVGRWWAHFYPPRMPAGATHACAAPLLSSWYAFHQHPTQAELEKELPLAAELGFGSMIVDDGWSYPGSGTGDYIHCGTWLPDRVKFPDMAAFVAKAGEYGIKTALWFPLPFVGPNDPDFDRFRNRLLFVDENIRAGVLDVRYPTVRAYLIQTLARLCRDYNLCGLKLDFLNDLTRPAPAPGRECDCLTTTEGVRKLLAALDDALTIPQEELLIEFRQYYLGPAVTRHCNMLRVCDCAFDVISNRIGVVDLRMLRYPLAIHSDMLLWAGEETPENCAVMLLNVLFAVPQISVQLQYAPPEQLAVLRRYLSYWNAHRKLLLFGELTALEPEANYTAVSAQDDALRVIALYSPRIFSFDGKATDAWNATTTDKLIFCAEVPGTAVGLDCFGNRTGCFSFMPGAVELRVPRGGMVQLRVDQRAVFD